MFRATGRWASTKSRPRPISIACAMYSASSRLAVAAMENGTAKVFIGLGGNFVRAVPDTDRSYAAMRNLALTVAITTKLNRGHLVHGRDALILPVVARSEVIRTAAGEQFITIEDS